MMEMEGEELDEIRGGSSRLEWWWVELGCCRTLWLEAAAAAAAAEWGGGGQSLAAAKHGGLRRQQQRRMEWFWVVVGCCKTWWLEIYFKTIPKHLPELRRKCRLRKRPEWFWSGMVLVCQSVSKRLRSLGDAKDSLSGMLAANCAVCMEPARRRKGFPLLHVSSSSNMAKLGRVELSGTGTSLLILLIASLSTSAALASQV
ncbi:hypothetical protein Nepgr_028833 [Nepenthes gracilis]|uniref:Uncharacterized protein n=1 Tax=Nepenthes gracilis TaxID=150966 RepID=A0AAD3TB42_NEPGR|nr:hypothetical protein Nepgr_028833 [Nepenthes gracilis]